MTDRPKLPGLRGPTTIDMFKNASGGFDAEAYFVMDKRDNQLIADEIMHGAGSPVFVYNFKIKGKEITGISAIGARHLASHYGRLKHRIVSSIQKTGALHTVISYPSDTMPMAVNVAQILDLRDEPDYYAVLIEVTDLHTGNVIQVEQRESRLEYRDDGSSWDKPHFVKVAQSKAYRNAVLGLMPQDFVLKWKLEMLKLQKGELITESVIDQKRKGILSYTAKEGIPLLRSAINELTMDQIAGLSDAAKEKDRGKFTEALEALSLIERKEEDVEEKQPSKRAERQEEHPPQEGGREKAHGEEGTRARQGKPQTAGKRPSLFRDDDE